ncbi:hypothetical protein F5Y19DRAFT_481025 [Xylariaceae sp. FL1651]|nr:hypothetical protein F5Y19DRAFT_481025 [Xylariaceae sp. FL1651]
MQLKRKRSESELSSSTTSTFGSPLRSSSFSPASPNTTIDVGSFRFSADFPISPLSRYNNNHNFPLVAGRTMKRFRNNRPSENEVHQRTLNMLYAAQRQQKHAQAHETPDPAQILQQAPVATQPGAPSSVSSSSHQTSLHSFWNLPSRPLASAAACLPPTLIDTPSECEDCGQDFGGDDDAMMDVDDLSATLVSSGGVRAVRERGEKSSGTNGNSGRIAWSRAMGIWAC